MMGDTPNPSSSSKHDGVGIWFKVSMGKGGAITEVVDGDEAMAEIHSTSTREEDIQTEMEKCKTMKISELKKELSSLDVSTSSFIEKGEFVSACAEARVDAAKAANQAIMEAAKQAAKDVTRERNNKWNKEDNAESNIKDTKKSSPSSSSSSTTPESPLSREEQILRETMKLRTMKASELKKELASYGISTAPFFEKSEYVRACAEARVDGIKKINNTSQKTNVEKKTPASTSKPNQGTTPTSKTNKSRPSPTSSSSTTKTKSSAARDAKIEKETEKCKAMKISELKKELASYGISTSSFFEKTEFIKACAEARVDGAKKKTSIDNTSNNTCEYKEQSTRTLSLRSFLLNKIKCREHRKIRERNGEKNIPIILQQHLNMIRKSWKRERSSAGGSQQKLDTSARDLTDQFVLKRSKPFQIDKAPTTCLETFRDHYDSGQFRPTRETGSALSIMIELGELPVSTDPLVKDFSANCWSRNYVGDYDIDEARFEHLPIETLIEQHKQEVRSLRYNELVESISSQLKLDLDDCVFCKLELEIDQEVDSDDQEAISADKLNWEEIKPIYDEFDMGYYDYCCENDHLKKKHVEENAETCLYDVILDKSAQLQMMYKNANKPLGDPNLYIPPAIQDEISLVAASSNNGKKGKHSKKKSKGKKKTNPSKMKSHGSIMSRLVVNLVETILTTVQRPCLQYSDVIDSLARMLFHGIQSDIDLAMSICGEDQAGCNIIDLRQKSLEYAKTMDDIDLLPYSFSQGWYRSFGTLTIVLFCSVITVIDSDESARNTSKALDFCRKRILPELIQNVLSNSSYEVCVGWRAFDSIIKTIPMNMIIDIFSNQNIWNSIVQLCTKDVEVYLNGLGLRTEKERMREKKYYFQAAHDALCFVTYVCTAIRNECKNSTSRYDQFVQHIISQDVVGLCMTCIKKPKLDDAFILISLDSLVSVAEHRLCRDKLWEQKDEVIHVVKDTMSGNNYNHACSGMDLAYRLIKDDDGDKWNDLMMDMKPPIEDLAMKWIVFGMKHFCEKAYKAQSDYLHVQEGLIRRTDIYNAIRQKVRRTDDEDKFTADTTLMKKAFKMKKHWCYHEEKEQNEDNALTSSLFLVNKLSFNPEKTHQRFRRLPFFSVAAANFDSLNPKLVACSLPLLHHYFAKLRGSKIPLPTEFADPQFFVEKLEYFAYRQEEGDRDIARVIGDMASNILMAMRISDVWRSISNSIDEAKTDEEIIIKVKDDDVASTHRFSGLSKMTRFAKIAYSYAQALNIGKMEDITFWKGERRLSVSQSIGTLHLMNGDIVTARCPKFNEEPIKICVKSDKGVPCIYQISKATKFSKIAESFAKTLNVERQKDIEFWKGDRLLSISQTIEKLQLKEGDVITTKRLDKK